MKCIRYNGNTKLQRDLSPIERVCDEVAADRVASGNWKYVPKSEWKAQRAAETCHDNV